MISALEAMTFKDKPLLENTLVLSLKDHVTVDLFIFERVLSLNVIQYDETVSNFALKFNLRRFTRVTPRSRSSGTAR